MEGVKFRVKNEGCDVKNGGVELRMKNEGCRVKKGGCMLKREE
jgi:hypothetical protein